MKRARTCRNSAAPARFRCSSERPRAVRAIPRLITSATRRPVPRAQAQEPWPPARAARAARPRPSTTTASRTTAPSSRRSPRPSPRKEGGGFWSQIVESDDEPQKKRKSSSRKPAPKKARTEYTIEEHEKGTIKRPTENTITSTGAFNGEFAFALGTVCSVLCEKTNRWVTGHVIMFHRGGVTTKYAVKAVRVLFEKAQNGGKTHYQDCDVTTEKEADKRLVRLDLPKREVRLWTSGSPCMRACDLGHAAASKEKPLDPSRGFGASAEAAARAAQKKDFTYQGKGSEG